MFYDLLDPAFLLSISPDNNSIFPEFLALILPYNEKGLNKICINEVGDVFRNARKEFWAKLIHNCPAFQ